jgi:hypothetical protein
MTEKSEAEPNLEKAINKIYTELVAIDDNVSLESKEEYIHSLLNRADTIKDTKPTINGEKRLDPKEVINNLDFLYTESKRSNTKNGGKLTDNINSWLNNEGGIPKPRRLLIQRRVVKIHSNPKNVLVKNTNKKIDKAEFEVVKIEAENNFRKGLDALSEIEYRFTDNGNKEIIDDRVLIITPGSFIDTGAGRSKLSRDGTELYPKEESSKIGMEIFKRYGFPMITQMDVSGFNHENLSTSSLKDNIMIDFHMKSQYPNEPPVLFDNRMYAIGNKQKNKKILELINANDTFHNDEINKYLTFKELGDTLMVVYAREFMKNRSSMSRGSLRFDSAMITTDNYLTTRCRLLNVPVINVKGIENMNYDDGKMKEYLAKYAICSYYYPAMDVVDGTVKSMSLYEKKTNVKNWGIAKYEVIGSIDYNLTCIKDILLNEISIKINEKDVVFNNKDIMTVVVTDGNVNDKFLSGITNKKNPVITELLNENRSSNKTYSDFEITGWHPSTNNPEITGKVSKSGKIDRWGWNSNITKDVKNKNVISYIKLSYFLIYTHNILVLYKEKILKLMDTNSHPAENSQSNKLYKSFIMVSLFTICYSWKRTDIGDMTYIPNAVNNIINSIDLSILQNRISTKKLSMDKYGFTRGTTNENGVSNDNFLIPVSLDWTYIKTTNKSSGTINKPPRNFYEIIDDLYQITDGGGNKYKKYSGGDSLDNIDVWSVYRSQIKLQVNNKNSNLDKIVQGIDYTTYPYFRYIDAIIMSDGFVSILVKMVMSNSINYISLEQFWKAIGSPGPHDILEYTNSENDNMIARMETLHSEGIGRMISHNEEIPSLPPVKELTYPQNQESKSTFQMTTNKRKNDWDSTMESSNSEFSIFKNHRNQSQMISTMGGRRNVKKNIVTAKRYKHAILHKPPYRSTRKYRKTNLRKNSNRHKTRRV